MKEVEIHNKIALTIEEAAALSNIGQNTISELVNRPQCNFVLRIGKKRLIKRREFEDFISGCEEI